MIGLHEILYRLAAGTPDDVLVQRAGCSPFSTTFADGRPFCGGNRACRRPRYSSVPDRTRDFLPGDSRRRGARSGCARDDLESIHEGGSFVVLPTVAGFLFALRLALAQSFV